MDPRHRGVQGELADGDAHAARALVAQAQDPLVVRGHDEADVVEGRAAQDLVDPPALAGRDPEPAAPPEDPAVLLAGLAHGGRVHDGQELLEVVEEEPVEERLVALLQRGQADVALEGVRLAHDGGVHPADLLVEGAHRVRQQALEAEGLALLAREGGALVVDGMAQQRRAAVEDLHPHDPPVALLTVGLHDAPASAPDPPDTAGYTVALIARDK